MKNKIIVSLLLVLLIAISASAVSATDEVTDTIAESSSVDLEDPLETVNDNDDNLVSEDTEDISEIENVKDESSILKSNNVLANDNIQKTIDYDSTKEGDTILLRYINGTDRTYNLESPVVVRKSLTFVGGNIYASNLDCLFSIQSPANGGPSSITIKDTTFYIQNCQNVVNAKGVIQGINNVINISGITLENITILGMDETTQISQTGLLNIDTTAKVFDVSNEITVINNNYNGAKAIKLNNVIVSNWMGDSILEATEILQRRNTYIVAFSDFFEVVDKSLGDVGKYYNVILKDEYGNGLANKTVLFAFNGKTYSKTTDSTGTAKLQINLARAGKYDFVMTFLSDDYYYGSMVTTKVSIIKKDSTLIPKNVSYKANATKKLTVTLKSPVYEFVYDGKDSIYQKIKSYKLLKNKKVTFTVNGKTYTTTTTSKGVATVKISLNKKGTYTYTAKFAGDSLYNAITKKGKLTITALATSLATKKYTFKKAKKTKAIKVTLKSGTRVLKSKKITLKVNGKTYSAKTNSKGVATIKVSLSKKGTYKYTAKFAGDNMYKAVSKTNKVVITK